MLLTKHVEVVATGKLLTHLKENNYDVKSHQKIFINTTDLPINSRKKIDVMCDICGTEYKLSYKNYVLNISNGGYLSCNKCKNIKIKKTNLERYGVENISQIDEIKRKKEKTLIEHYGTTSIFEINKEKIKEKYGVDNVFQNEEIKEKIKKTNLERYGVENPQQNKEIKEKTLQTNLDRYGVKYISQLESVKEKLRQQYKENIKKKYSDLKIIDIDDNFEISIMCKKGHIYKSRSELIYDRKRLHLEECTICNPINSYSTSGREIELTNFIKENYNKDIIINSREIINPYEIDIYLPDLNLAFEFNGIYWHNELYKDKNYHQMKYELCKNKNIQLIQIWEDDWNYKQEIIKSMILNKLNKTENNIYGRKTEIKDLSDKKNNKLVREFLDLNHIQGFVGSSIKLGLFYNDNLVSLMTFIKKQKNIYELNRFCNKLNTNVIGGASKLLNYFQKNYNYSSIISFSNLTYSDGNLYKKLNFKIDSKLKPDYQYVVKDKRKHKFNFRLKNEKKKMFDNKIYRIYDAGKIKFILKKL